MLRPVVVLALILASGCADKAGDAVDPAPTPYAPRAALPVIEAAQAMTCVELPGLDAAASEAQRRLHPYAAAIRRLACEPALYTKTGAEAAAELGLPAEAEFGFGGPRTARVSLPKGVTVGDVAAVFGVAAPQVKVSWQAYHDITRLGSDPDTGAFNLYSPSMVWIGVDFDVDRYGADAGKERVIAAPRDAAVDRTVHVTMSAEAVKFVADPDAVPLVVSALAQLAAHPELLALKPDEAKQRVGLDGERYRVAETNSSRGERSLRGLSIDPQRTVLSAAELVAGLGLAGARAKNVNDEHDIWNVEVGGTTEIRWRGLELEILVDVEDGGRSAGLDGVQVSFMTIYPAP